MLAGGLAHDFNNILAGILGNISLVRARCEKDRESQALLSEAEAACRRAAELIRKLITFAPGGAPVKQDLVAAPLLKEWAASMLQGSNIQTDFNMVNNLWTITADADQLREAFQGIILNAQEAMPGGGALSLHAENLEIAALNPWNITPGKYLKISIQDNGVGIAAEHLPNIFDPFFSTKAPGRGLGLSVSYSVIKRHNGAIAASSLPGQGSVFTIFLPAFQQITEAIPLQPIEPAQPQPSKIKVLFMDDEEIIRKLSVRMLKAIGCEVDLAAEGNEAINKYKNAMSQGEPYHLVIMDLNVPGGMGGQETIKKLLKIDPQIKAIISSGYADDPVMAEYQAYGFSAAVPKPYRLEEMKNALYRVLGLAGDHS